MFNQHNGFCYPTLNDASQADISNPVLPVFNGIVSPVSFIPDSEISGNMTYLYRDFNTNALTTYTVQRVYPECLAVGRTNNSSGVTVNDAFLTSWLVVAVWAVAYLFKVTRSAARGY